jgi:heme-binding protein
MTRRLKQASVVFVVVFAAAQLVRPARGNPPIDSSRTIRTHAGTTGLAAVLDRSCRDCHSNATVWPWYTQIAPVSWLMASAVTKGRDAVNFSEWSTYTPDVQRLLLSTSCHDVSSGRMPGVYTLVRPETRLSPQDIETICTAAQAAAQTLAGGSK